MFFNRIKCDNIIVRTRLLSFFAICWLPFLIFWVIGYYNLGNNFFNLSHLLNERELLFNPVFSILVLLVMFTICLVSSIDLILSRPCFLGIVDSDLIFMGRKRIPLAEIEIDQIKLVGRFKNIVAIPRLGGKKALHVPLLKTDCSKGQSINVIKAGILQAFQRTTLSEL